MLTDAAVKGKVDTLQGLKENVILGSLIPAGTGRTDCQRETTERIVLKANKLKEIREQRARELAEIFAAKQPDELSRRDTDEDIEIFSSAAPVEITEETDSDTAENE